MIYNPYPISARNPSNGIMPPIIAKGFEVDVTRTHYLVEFKFASDFRTFRATGVGPYTHCHKKDIRKVFTLFTKEKALKNFNDLMQAFANKGYKVTEIRGDAKGYQYIPIVY